MSAERKTKAEERPAYIADGLRRLCPHPHHAGDGLSQTLTLFALKD